MTFKKISAIVRSHQLEAVEKQLQELRVPGISVTPMKGFGEYANFGRRDWLSREVRIELFVCEEDVEPIVEAIADRAQTGTAGDGLVAILPVDDVIRIRTGERALHESLYRRGDSK